jgi:hypothetical protein
LKASVSITYTRHRSKFSKVERSEEVTFDAGRCSVTDAASRVIDALEEYVRNARLRRR